MLYCAEEIISWSCTQNLRSECSRAMYSEGVPARVHGLQQFQPSAFIGTNFIFHYNYLIFFECQAEAKNQAGESSTGLPSPFFSRQHYIISIHSIFLAKLPQSYVPTSVLHDCGTLHRLRFWYPAAHIWFASSATFVAIISLPWLLWCSNNFMKTIYLFYM